MPVPPLTEGGWFHFYLAFVHESDFRDSLVAPIKWQYTRTAYMTCVCI